MIPRGDSSQFARKIGITEQLQAEQTYVSSAPHYPARKYIQSTLDELCACIHTHLSLVQFGQPLILAAADRPRRSGVDAISDRQPSCFFSGLSHCCYCQLSC